MEQHYWWIFALFQPLGFASIVLVNQHYKLEGFSIAMIRSAIVVLCILPVLPFIETPTVGVFYAVSLTAAVLAFFGDSLVMNSAAKFGAGPTSRLLPLSPLISFVIWSVLHPEIFDKFADNPVISAGLVASIFGCALAIFSLRKCTISKGAFMYLFPVIVIYAINDVMNKLAQGNSSFWGGVVWYTFILACGSVALGLFINLKNKTLKATLTDKNMQKAGVIIGLVYMFAMFGRNISMVYTPNPAYTSIIAGATPLVVIAYHKIYNIEDNASVASGVMFAGSVLTMIYLATLLQ